MLERIINFSIRQRWLILIATAVIAVLGIYNYQRLTIDAVPQLRNVSGVIDVNSIGGFVNTMSRRIPIDFALTA
jgi:cobalt-zinc-cadmium resistance protein CzcA